MKSMFLYGIGGAENNYRVVRYTEIPEDSMTVLTYKYEASMMDNRHGLRRDYTVAYKKNSIESWAIFKDILEREGIEIK